MITTRWHQDYPWNTLCPPDLMRPAKAGCTPIATSQIIYYYRKNDIRNCEIPYDYIVINNKPYFPYKSTSEWSNLRETASSNEDENRSTALFIFYIGDMLGTQYLIWTGGSTPLLCLEGVPDLPVAPQDEAGLTKTFQTWPRGWFHIP